MIETVHFRFDAADDGWAEARPFYRDVLGMAVEHDGRELVCRYPGRGAAIRFATGTVARYESTDDAFYWKLGIVVADLDAAYAHLQSCGVEVAAPRQFRDIGYLTHLRDPFGLPLELLQVGFEGHARAAGCGHPIGARSTLAHLTLRVTDHESTETYLVEQLGMRLMSVQAVADLGFTLYFYAWSDEPLPDPDLGAVENREWLWARPYTLVEIQHRWRHNAKVVMPSAGAAGFAGFSYRQADAAGILGIEALRAACGH